MKIAILTQPLHTNYGGLMQAYALQTVLMRMGHEVATVDLPFRKPKNKARIKTFKRFLRKYITGKAAGSGTIDMSSKNTQMFIDENINLTQRIAVVEQLPTVTEQGFEAFIVGSDQVWRPRYSPGIFAFFLDFLGNNREIIRIAYAASFGVDAWEFTPEQARRCAELAKIFDAISVREDSGITLCEEHLDVQATHVLDPTLLLKEQDYLRLLAPPHTEPDFTNLSLTTYVLDRSADKNRIIETIASYLKLKVDTVLPKELFSGEPQKNNKAFIYPPMSSWLAGFKNAEFIVTDSFHGTVFSIIFNKPFIVIGNEERGISRFSSLLNLLGLTDRLISSYDEISPELIDKTIDYERVNQLWEASRKKSLSFLEEALES